MGLKNIPKFHLFYSSFNFQTFEYLKLLKMLEETDEKFERSFSQKNCTVILSLLQNIGLFNKSQCLLIAFFCICVGMGVSCKSILG